MLELIMKSIVIGGLAGAGVGAGAARMYYAPELQAAGAFRTLGEMNACQGDPVSHFSFGFSFYINCMANGLATGCFDQDFLHRVIPNVSAGILLTKNKDVKETIQNPAKMAVVGAIVGIIGLVILNSSVSFVPAYVSTTLTEIFTPAINNFLIVMQVLFLIAALDNGKVTGCWGIALGSIAFLVTGNATPGLILGIITGQTIENNGVKSKISIVFIVLMVVIWLLIAYFRGFFPTLIDAFTAAAAMMG